MKSEPLELLLHIGLPKTGSTALQMWCRAEKGKLLTRGIHYPNNSWQPHLAHNHQYLVGDLLQGKMDRFLETLQGTPAPRICLSTEGLTNHLYDFPEQSLGDFRAATSAYRVRLFVVLREPEAWIHSYYKQALINPPIQQYAYATSLDQTSFALLPRVKRLTDTRQLLDDAQRTFGAHSVTTADYESDWFGSFLSFLGLKAGEFSSLPVRANASLAEEVSELIRQINGLALEPAERAHCLWLLAQQLDDVPDTMKYYSQLPSSDARRFMAETSLRLIASKACKNTQISQAIQKACLGAASQRNNPILAKAAPL